MEQMILFYHTKIKFDGVSIGFNEPTSFTDLYEQNCTLNRFNNPSFIPNIQNRENLSDKTICMDSMQSYGDRQTG